jgi:hypothetical protein
MEIRLKKAAKAGFLFFVFLSGIIFSSKEEQLASYESRISRKKNNYKQEYLKIGMLDKPIGQFYIKKARGLN